MCIKFNYKLIYINFILYVMELICAARADIPLQ